jgi:hypothetical protein
MMLPSPSLAETIFNAVGHPRVTGGVVGACMENPTIASRLAFIGAKEPSKFGAA